MAIAYVTDGGFANGTTSLSVAYPGSIAAGNLLILSITNKYPTNGPATPAGWTAPAGNQLSGGAGSSGGDSGQVYTTIFYKIATGSETGSVSVTITGANCAIGIIVQFSKAAAKDWGIALTSGADNTGNASVSYTASANPGITAADLLYIAAGINTSAASYSAHAVTATGVTWGGVTAGPGGNSGADHVGQVVAFSTAASGNASVAPVFSMTADASNANAPTGAAIFVRLRELNKQIAGIAAGICTVAGTLTAASGGSSQIIGSSAGTSSPSATIRAKGNVIGSTAGSVSFSAGLSGRGALTGSSAGASTVSASIRGRVPIDGSAAGTSTVAGTIRAKGLIVATSAGVATNTGALQAKGSITGSSAGSVALSGDLKGKASISGSSAGSAVTAGSLSARGSLSGSIAGIGAASASIVGKAAISGSANGSSIVTGTLGVKGNYTGSSAGSSTTTGIITGKAAIAGSSAGTGLAAGALGGRVKVVGNAACSSSVAATITGRGRIVGQVLGSSALSGALTPANSTAQISGTASGTCTISGMLNQPVIRPILTMNSYIAYSKGSTSEIIIVHTLNSYIKALV